MEFLVLPISANSSCPNGGPWTYTNGVLLNGYFYDHLQGPDGALVGIRYWLDENTRPSEHPVFRQFVDDPRFRFDPEQSYLDLVFQEEHAQLLEMNLLRVDTVQDFGGDAVAWRNRGQIPIKLSAS